ncbi:MAG: hypothetical protein CVU05_09735 [Bacteroidetes bacterium HGW-Bacteroidetes-21]|nr:MAG: hypothetical protein CVU05_09735 [Bacteroidetes bacterium HGW-Bacteroidetes-21]
MFLFSCSDNQKTTDETTGKDSVATQDESAANIEGQRYGVKSGIVYYEPFDMMGIKTSQVLYFDDYGKKEARETITEGTIMGMKTKKRSINIIDGKYSISFDLENITNNKDELKKVATRMDMSNNPFAQFDMSAMGEKMKEEFDYKEEGTEEVAGVTGTKYSIKMSKEAKERISGVMYKNISLKVDMGQIKMVASKFEENVTVPESIFSVPADYKIEEVDPFAGVNQMGE